MEGFILPEYTIIRVKEEIACYYFQKSDLLYRFLMNYRNNNENGYLKRQYTFITKFFSHEKVMYQLKRLNWDLPGIVKKGSKVEVGSEQNNITLQISKKHIRFWCDTMQDAEALLFPALRMVYPYLFVVCEDYANYGWVSPISNKEQQKQEQVLYSYP